MKRVLAAACAGWIAMPSAQPVPDADLPPPHACRRPAVPVPKGSPDTQAVIAYVGELDSYTVCVQKYAEERKKAAQALMNSAADRQRAAQAQIGAANAAVKEYNDYLANAEKSSARK